MQTVQDFAREWGVHVNTVYRWIGALVVAWFLL